MKNFFVLALLISAFVGCNTADDSKVDAMKSPADTVKQDNLIYPYTPVYSSKFEIGDPNHALAVLNLYKDWDNNTLDNSKHLFADVDSFFFSDGTILIGSRDSLISVSKKMRNSLGTVQSEVQAWVPLKSTDKNENWVAIWTREIKTATSGKKDSTNLHEVWRFNKDGKIDLVFQYEQKQK